MKTVKLTFFFIMLATSKAFCVPPTAVGQMTFNGGYVPAKFETELNDNESKDMCNCIVESDGGLTKRLGSKRFISQAISTYPISSMYRYYASTQANANKTLIVVVGNKILHSTGGVNPFWTLLSSNITPGDRWSWVTTQNVAIGTSLNNRIVKFDLNASSFQVLLPVVISTVPIEIKAKYSTIAKNYYIVANVSVSTSITPTQYLPNLTTYYPSRIYYDNLLDPSSMTAEHYIEYRTDSGEELTGIDSMFDKTHLFKPSSIGELNFSVLNTPSRGGDWTLQEVVTDFGLEAPYTLQKRGGYYILGTKFGIQLWNGYRRQVYNPQDYLTLISQDIRPLIEKLIKAGTYKDSVGKYYPKRDWYFLFYNDPDLFPKGALNACIIYDFKIGKWFPLCGWTGGSLEVFGGAGDKGEIFYGDSMDSYVYQIDTRVNDARKEIILDGMDRETLWTGANQDTTTVIEGTSSLRMWINSSVTESSMTNLSVFSMGEWNDKTVITKNDKLAFKIYPTSVGAISNLRVDFEVNNVSGAFDSNFTSVTLTSSAFTNGSNNWTTLEIALSSFPIRPDWTDLNTENVAFAPTPTYFGIRFVMNGIHISSISIDDLRVVQATENPVKFKWTSKMFSFGDVSIKNFGETILTYEKTPESFLKVDFLKDFGNRVNTKLYLNETDKELMVTQSTGIIAVLSSVDFSVLRSSVVNTSEFIPINGNSDRNYTVITDRNKHRLMKFDKNSFGVLLATYGALGSGATNFNIPHQLKINKQSIYVVDLGNNRIKEHSLNDLSFVKMNGTLGAAATSYHKPTGISVNDDFATVANEGNFVLKQVNISSFGFMNQSPVDYNKSGDSTLEEDSIYSYLAYEKIAPDNLGNIDIVLEKRIKTSSVLVNRLVIRVKNTTVSNKYNLKGDIVLIGNNIFIAFTDDFSQPTNTRNYYIQKINRDDLSLVDQYKTNTRIYSLIGYANSYLSTRKVERKRIGASGTYLQMRYYDDENDNYVKLINQTILLDQTPLSYSPSSQ